MKISGSCHCGLVGFEITEEPEYLVDCNCSICHRLASLWGHIDKGSFNRTGEGATIAYRHGDKMISFHSCANCGCTTHWEGHLPQSSRMAVNFRMCSPEILHRYKVRRFDGRDSWKFLEEHPSQG